MKEILGHPLGKVSGIAICVYFLNLFVQHNFKVQEDNAELMRKMVKTEAELVAKVKENEKNIFVNRNDILHFRGK